jgi:hypothetical protein
VKKDSGHKERQGPSYKNLMKLAFNFLKIEVIRGFLAKQ